MEQQAAAAASFSVEEQDDNNGIASIVALCYSNKTLGVACYSEISNTILIDSMLMNESSTEKVFTRIKYACNPTMFLLHPTILSNQALLDVILCGLDSPENKQAYPYQILKTSLWNRDTCLEVITSKLVTKAMAVKNRNQSHSRSNNNHANYLFLGSLIDFDNAHLVQALGSLLHYMQMNTLNLDEGSKICVAEVKAFPNTEYMKCDKSTLLALQIFAEEVHPNMIKENNHNKEGFSLFSFLDRTRSKPGRDMLRSFLLRPFCDIEKINERLDAIGFVVDTANHEMIQHVLKLLRKIHDVPKLLLRIKKVEATHVDWCRFISTLEAAIHILNIFISYLNQTTTTTDDNNFVAKLYASVDYRSCQEAWLLLQQVIDVTASIANGSLHIKDNYDYTWDRLRQQYEHLEHDLRRAALEILELSPLLQHVAVEYVPQIGYLVVVSQANAQFINITVDDADNHYNNNSVGYGAMPYQFVFQQDDSLYYKHPIVNQLDDSIGDIKNKIIDHQQRLLLVVEDKLLEHELALFQLSEMLATLDVYIALGMISYEMNFSRPLLVTENVIVIKQGRHVLQELVVNTFVPNDTFISKDKNIALITGANASGKSIYLKQVGLMVFLAHIGCWLPCEKAIIGLTDQLFTRISSAETIASNHSSFSMDLNQMSFMLRAHTPQSLCLIDEFGKGTSPIDGIALLAATIKHFAVHKAKALFVLHFTEVLHPDILQPHELASITAFKMATFIKPLTVAQQQQQQHEFMTDEDDLNNNSNSSCDEYYQESTALFQLQVGIATSSESIACARVAGIEESVLKRAVQLKELIKHKRKIPPSVDVMATRYGLLQDMHVQSILFLFLTTDWAPIPLTATNTSTTEQQQQQLQREEQRYRLRELLKCIHSQKF